MSLIENKKDKYKLPSNYIIDAKSGAKTDETDKKIINYIENNCIIK